MSKGDQFENDILDIVFTATTVSGLFRDATDGLTNLWVSLHDGDPGDAGDQTTSEATYGGYARASVTRSTSGWAVTNNAVSPVSQISFPECTGGVTTAGYFGVGTASSGAGKLLYKGTVSPAISITSGVTPRLTTGSSISED